MRRTHKDDRRTVHLHAHPKMLILVLLIFFQCQGFQSAFAYDDEDEDVRYPTSYLVDQTSLRRLEIAQKWIRAGQPRLAISALQMVLDEPDDSFLETSSRKWQSLREIAEI